MVPYTGTVTPHIQKIEPGHATVLIKDRKRVRNHLHSIHAIALANLGELASGLAMIAALPDNTRGIVTNIEIDYLKKARGSLTAKGEANPPDTVTDPITLPAYAVITDSEGDRVANVTVHWLLSPRDKS
jgi:acyl-coenzyme A thioesterase PaaI-like protein